MYIKDSRTLDPLMLQQQFVYQNQGKNEEEIDKLLIELGKFNKITDLKTAKALVFELFPKFKDNSSFVKSGVVYTLFESEELFRLIVEFSDDEIYCYDYLPEEKKEKTEEVTDKAENKEEAEI